MSKQIVEENVVNFEHLNSFSITNFKCFKSIELNNLGQFNLIIGDNNIGKTSLLEALLFTDNRIETLKNYHKTLCYRDVHIHHSKELTPNGLKIHFPNESYLSFLLHNDKEKMLIKAESNQKKIDIGLQQIHKDLITESDKKLIENEDSISKNLDYKYWIRWFENDELSNVSILYSDELNNIHDRYIPFIKALKGYSSDLRSHFIEISSNNRFYSKEIEENLREFIPNLDEIGLRRIDDQELIGFGLKGRSDYVPITSYGDGVVRFFRILIEIIKCKNKRLMIDELTNGIHYSRLVSFWQMIIKACIKNNVQLFATTHSSECISAYKKALTSIDFEKYQEISRITNLDINLEGDVFASIYEFQEFSSNLVAENEMR